MPQIEMLESEKKEQVIQLLLINYYKLYANLLKN
jgi:hypothetical protein